MEFLFELIWIILCGVLIVFAIVVPWVALVVARSALRRVKEQEQEALPMRMELQAMRQEMAVIRNQSQSKSDPSTNYGYAPKPDEEASQDDLKSPTTKPPVIGSATLMGGSPLMEPVPAELASPKAEPVAEESVKINMDELPDEAAPLVAQLVDTPAKPAKPITPAVPEESGSFEMKLGAVWFVRIGVVLMLTGLAFLANIGYGKLDESMQKIVSAGVLYLISFAMLGLGTWLPRRSETLANYGQVLAAGGLAGVYFTTYSMQFHYDFLSPVAASVLLLGWAAFIVWLADKRQSELMAFCAIGGAFYASFIPLIHGDGGPTLMLVSNAVLSGAAVWFLIRNRWAKLTTASVAATYLGFGIWRFVIERPQLTDPGMFWICLAFLLCYWAIFSAAAIYSRSPQLNGWPRALLLGSNTVFLFVYLAIPLGTLQSVPGWENTFTLLPAVLGFMLLGVFAKSATSHPEETALREASLVMGLVMVTLAIVTFNYLGNYTGIVLAAQSTLVFYLGSRRPNLTLRIGASIAGAMGLAWGLYEMFNLHSEGLNFNPNSVWLGFSIAGFLTASAWIATRFANKEDELASRLAAAGYLAAAVLMLLVATIANTLHSHPAWTAPILAMLGLATATLVYWLRIREAPGMGQALLLFSQGITIIHLTAKETAAPGWSLAIVLVITAIFLLWWQRQDDSRANLATRRAGETINALALSAMAIGIVWVNVDNPATFLWATPIIAVVGAVLALAARQLILAAASQLFLLMSIMVFLPQVLLNSNPPQLLIALMPIVALFSLGQAMLSIAPMYRDEHPVVCDAITTFSRIYAATAALLGLICLFHSAYLDPENRVWVAMLIGAALFTLHGWQPALGRMEIGFLFTGVGLLIFLSICLFNWNQSVWLPNLIALTGLLCQQQIARHFPKRFTMFEIGHTTLIVLGCAGIFLWMSRWGGSGFYLTAIWATLAFAYVGAGLKLRERALRLSGLSLLTLAIVRIGIFDIWNIQDQVARTLSLMALGAVLLALGYLYNRHRESIRQWL